MKTLSLIRPDDWHMHLRDGVALRRTVADAAAQFRRVLVMPNLTQPVVTAEDAAAYLSRILAELPENKAFFPLMSLYMTDDTTPEMIEEAAAAPHVYAVKLYPAGATTHSAAGVTDIHKIYPTLAAMEKAGLPLLVHGEVTYGDIFDREARFVDTILDPLRKQFPQLKMVLEHVSTQHAVDYVRAADANLAATITPHHLLFNRNQLLVGGIKPHYYCLPILKHENDQAALIAAAISGNPKFFLGTDSAPHPIPDKESACGCAGIYNAFSALEWYATVFAAHNALDKLEAFASFYGADFYGLPRNQDTITLREESWQIPDELPFGNSHVHPLGAGETITWRVAT